MIPFSPKHRPAFSRMSLSLGCGTWWVLHPDSCLCKALQEHCAHPVLVPKYNSRSSWQNVKSRLHPEPRFVCNTPASWGSISHLCISFSSLLLLGLGSSLLGICLLGFFGTWRAEELGQRLAVAALVSGEGTETAARASWLGAPDHCFAGVSAILSEAVKYMELQRNKFMKVSPSPQTTNWKQQ